LISFVKLQAARADNIHIYAVGIGLRNTRELDRIASTPHTENSFNVQSFDELKGLDKKIFSALCPSEYSCFEEHYSTDSL
jgi:hypothetical protein